MKITKNTEKKLRNHFREMLKERNIPENKIEECIDAGILNINIIKYALLEEIKEEWTFATTRMVVRELFLRGVANAMSKHENKLK